MTFPYPASVVVAVDLFPRLKPITLAAGQGRPSSRSELKVVVPVEL